MWIIQEPKKVALWNKRHFEEKNGECVACLKYSVLIFVEKIYIKCNIWRVVVRPSYIWDARFLKVNCNWVATRCQSYSTHIHTNNIENDTKQTIHRTTQKYIEQHKQYIKQHKNMEECRPCPIFAGFTLAFALQLRKKHGKTSVRVVIHKHTHGGTWK
jgi:hypothetical protein